MASKTTDKAGATGGGRKNLNAVEVKRKSHIIHPLYRWTLNGSSS